MQAERPSKLPTEIFRVSALAALAALVKEASRILDLGFRV